MEARVWGLSPAGAAGGGGLAALRRARVGGVMVASAGGRGAAGGGVAVYPGVNDGGDRGRSGSRPGAGPVKVNRLVLENAEGGRV